MKKYILYSLYVLLFCLIAIKKFPLIKSINYNQDEVDYVGNSLLWSEYKVNYSPQVWTLPWAYDQPHLYHFLVGILTESKLNSNLRESFMQRFPKSRQYMVKWNREYTGNYSGTTDSRFHFITKVRIISFTLYLLIFLVFGIVCFNIFGNLGLYYSLLFFFSNRNFDATLISAVSDGLLLLIVLLSILLWQINLKKKNPFNFSHIIIQSILAGLAISTKLNGIILILIMGIVLTYNLFEKSIFLVLKKVAISGIISFLVFVILNPYLWTHTIDRTVQMFEYRLTTNRIISQQLPNICPPNSYILDRIFFNSRHLLNFQNPTIASAIILFVVILSSIYIIIYTKSSILKKNILIILIILQLVTLSNISVYWSRYFIPAQIGLSLNFLMLFSIIFDKKTRAIPMAISFLKRHEFIH